MALHGGGDRHHQAEFASSIFVSRDPFAGMPEMPYSLHPYQYGYSNPILWTDPSGQVATTGDCKQQMDLCKSELTTLRSYKLGIDLSQFCEWSLSELQSVRSGIASWTTVAGWLPNQFQRAIAPKVPLVEIVRDPQETAYGPAGRAEIFLHAKTFREAKAGDPLIIPIAVVHELSHTWAWAWEGAKRYNGLDILHGFVQATGGSWPDRYRVLLWYDCNGTVWCTQQISSPYHMHGVPPSVYAASKDGTNDPGEDWAESVAATVFPDYKWYRGYILWSTTSNGSGVGVKKSKLVIDQARQDYVHAMFLEFQH